MKSCENIKNIYNESKSDLTDLLYGEKHTEKNLLLILKKLCFNEEFNIYNKNKYDLDEIQKLFRYYEKNLNNFFDKDKCTFEWLFKCYIILTKVFTELCLVFSITLDKKIYIYQFLQLLKESNNMVKFFIALEQRHIKILNNLIGEQLYYFTHLEHKTFENKDINYVIDYFYLSLEKQFHGFELSQLSDFGGKEFVDETSEYMIYMNNASFLLLKLLCVLKIEFEDISFFEKNKFEDILGFYKKISKLNKEKIFNTLKSFEESLIEEFQKSNEYLNKNKDYNMLDEKVKLLQINTDEYKQLIDIISVENIEKK